MELKLIDLPYFGIENDKYYVKLEWCEWNQPEVEKIKWNLFHVYHIYVKLLEFGWNAESLNVIQEIVKITILCN